MKHQLGLKHEGQGTAKIVWLEFSTHCTLEGLCIRPVCLHTAVQTGGTGNEPLCLGVILAEDQAHELVHRVAVEPGRTKSMLRHHPPWRKDAEVHIGCTRH